MDIPLSRVFGSIANYSCLDGFILMGVARRTCQADMTWSGVTPTCHRECVHVCVCMCVYVCICVQHLFTAKARVIESQAYNWARARAKPVSMHTNS